MATIIDLTHPLGPDANVPGALAGPRIDAVKTMASHGRTSSIITMSAHTGTHLDAPWHVVDQGEDIGALALGRLIGPAVVWDVSMTEPRGLGPPDFDAARPSAQPGDAVLLSTGWAGHYATPAYRDRPWITVDGAVWLREHAVRLIGFDFASPEQPLTRQPPTDDFAVHHELLGHGVLIVENVADLSAIHGRRVRLFVIAAPVKGIDGFPARVFAEI